MRFEDISLPDVYTDSADFRFFCKWLTSGLEQVKYDTENLLDLYDPLRCPSDLLWMLGDTMGYKYDNRQTVAFNRFVLLYFMSMIRNKGSKDGLLIAAETNLKQFDIDLLANKGYTNSDGEVVHPNPILNERLDDTSLPVNSAYVTPHVAEGYIDIVYFSTQLPTDTCTEYVRPVGMYVFQSAGVKYDTRTKISVDARLTNIEDEAQLSMGPTHVGHYSREDYARMQRLQDSDLTTWTQGLSMNEVPKLRSTEGDRHVEPRLTLHDTRHAAWYRNSKEEDGSGVYGSGATIDAGYRAMYSLQLSNNEHVAMALAPEVFSIGYGPQDVNVTYADDYLKPEYRYKDKYSDDTVVQNKPWNLRYDEAAEQSQTTGVFTLDPNRTSTITHPVPAVNPVMSALGDAIAVADDNSKYTKVLQDGEIIVEDVDNH